MKKILVTMLALSLAAVSSVDAKMMKRGGMTSGAMAGAAAVKPAEIMEVSKEVLDAKKDKDTTGAEEAANDLVTMLTNPNMTADERELNVKRARDLELEKEIKAYEIVKSDIGHGWLGFFRSTKEQKEQHKKTQDKINELRKDQKQVQSRIRELETITGKKYSVAIRTALTTLGAVGVTLVAYGIDKYAFEGRGKAAISGYVGQGWEATKGAARTTSRYLRGKVGRLTGAEKELAVATDDLKKMNADLKKNPKDQKLIDKIAEQTDYIARLGKEIEMSTEE